jgi:FixJ family two-component response regulator
MADMLPLVAIVDDEEPVRTALGRLLRTAGMEPRPFATADAFLAFAAERRPSCLVLDLHLPGCSGLQLLRRLQTMGTRYPTVVITGYEEAGTREDCLAAGADAYLTKPIDEQVLLGAIAAALAARSKA